LASIKEAPGSRRRKSDCCGGNKASEDMAGLGLQ
jgi:hypothetical protein